MDVIELAALPAETPLVAVLVTMQARRQSGVVCVERATLHLATAISIVNALQEKKKTLGDVSGLAPVSTILLPQPWVEAWPSHKWIASAPRGGELQERGARVLQNPLDSARLELQFAQVSGDYQASELVLGRASIVTRYESLTALLAADPSRPNCSCNSTFHNIPLIVGMNCPKHGCPVT